MTLSLIPTRATEEQSAEYVGRIVATFNAATPEQAVRGMRWYPLAHTMAQKWGETCAGAGIIAAYSANTGWDRNVKLANETFSTREVRPHIAAEKVGRIIAGECPRDVLPMIKKTGYFFQCINDPSHETAVVIDRHAHDIAVGVRYGDADRGLDNVNRYNTLADAYRAAALIVGCLPQEVQAVTWTVHVDAWSGKRV